MLRRLVSHIGLLILVGHSGWCFALYGEVVDVTDGETLTLLDASNSQHKIRLSGIDAPEMTQAFGSRSKQSLLGLAFNRVAMVETTKRDRYGRNVGKVLIDGQDVNLIQVERGMAWVYRAYEAEQSVEDRATYAYAEGKAKVGKQGLWSGAAPQPPWAYRQQMRKPGL
jgi:endonuclease YncB( thermonuclease family)